MQLSDREIQNTLDMLKKAEKMGPEEERTISAEELEDIRQLVSKFDDAPEIRQDRVEKIKKALESSSYTVTGDDVAKKLIGRIFSDKLQ